ncbi:MAG: sulfite exporter TauE/SafE family protein [Acidobacteriota bacterium]|nr:sulfite exporter TauE/SafE family protein [Acidobacteriota bacterium]
MTIKTLLILALAGFTVFFVVTLAAAMKKNRGETPSLLQTAIGFVTNFFDTLGIGSFAPTTAIFKLKKLVPDELIPGTLNVGHTLPTITQALIFITIVEVEPITLSLLILAAVLGTWLGAGVVSKWPRRNIQIGMGVALLVAAGLTLQAIYDQKVAGGTALQLTGVKLALGFAGNFALGALMSLGIGLYGPCLILISLLGMDPKAAFPIMMGSCAFLMPVGSARFVREGSFQLRSALGLALGGIPAVLLAVYIVKSMPLKYVRWLVVIVVVYTAVMMLRSALAEKK